MAAETDADDALHEAAEELLAREVDDKFAISALTLAEVLVAPTREGRLDAVLETLRDLEIAERPLPVDAAARLARLRVTTRARMPDCCVLLAAKRTRPD